MIALKARRPLLEAETLARGKAGRLACKHQHIDLWPVSHARHRSPQNSFFDQVSGVFSFTISRSRWYLNGRAPRWLIQLIIC